MVKFEKLNLLKSHDLDNNQIGMLTRLPAWIMALHPHDDLRTTNCIYQLQLINEPCILHINLECRKCQGKSSFSTFSEYTALQNIEFPWCDVFSCLLHDLTDLVHTNASGPVWSRSWVMWQKCLQRGIERQLKWNILQIGTSNMNDHARKKHVSLPWN